MRVCSFWHREKGWIAVTNTSEGEMTFTLVGKRRRTPLWWKRQLVVAKFKGAKELAHHAGSYMMLEV